MKPDKKIIQQLTDDYFNNHKNWFFENLEALEYKEQFILQEIDRTESALKELEKSLQNPNLRSDDNIAYLQGGYKYLELLKAEHKKLLPPQPISINESRTKKVIFETITNIDKQGWQYAFVSEQDYNLFTDLLTNFFEYKPYTLPETTIQLKRTCKTKVAKALGEIHKELSNENKLSADTNYFQLIRVLSHFEKETEGDLYKALTR